MHSVIAAKSTLRNMKDIREELRRRDARGVPFAAPDKVTGCLGGRDATG